MEGGGGTTADIRIYLLALVVNCCGGWWGGGLSLILEYMYLLDVELLTAAEVGRAP